MLKSRPKSDRRPRIGITMGDPAGVGPEVAARALANLKLSCDVVVIGNESVFSRYWKGRDFPDFVHLADKSRVIHRPGVSTPASGKDSLLYLDHAVEMLQTGRIQAVVTGPVSKESIGKFVNGFKGHTTYLAQAFHQKNVEMLFVAGTIRMVLVTRHVALKEVPPMITTQKVLSVISVTHDFLKQSFSIKSPRIAVCGLNPHAGEGGHIGREDVTAIAEALGQARKRGMNVIGPLPADTVFEPHQQQAYDLIVSMYHDQGLPVLKAMYFDKLVNVTVGLPFVRTSPAHGTAFGIAGKGIADAGSMREAIQLAARLV